MRGEQELFGGPGVRVFLSVAAGRCRLFSFFLLVLCWTSLTGPFLSAGKGVLRYSVPKWLSFPEAMWGVVFTACVVFLFFRLFGGPGVRVVLSVAAG